MSFSELRREIANSLAAGQTRQQRELLFSFHLRFSLPVATLTLVSVLLAMRSSDLASRLLLAVVSCLAYWILLYAGDEASLRGYLAPPIGAWLPNLVLIATAFVIASSSSSRLRGQSGVAT